MDTDAQVLLFFGGEDILYDIPYRRLFLRLMQTVWGDWEIRWAYQGVSDIAAYVGYPVEKVLVVEENNVIGETLIEPPPEKEWVDTIGSILFMDEELALFPLYGDVDGYLTKGLSPFLQVDKSVGCSSIHLGEWSSNFLTGGFHIDMLHKKVEYWCAKTMSDTYHRIQEKWPDWLVIWHQSEYERHLEVTAGNLTFQLVDEKKLISDISEFLLRAPGTPVDTLQSVIQRLSESNNTVLVNPVAFCHANHDLPQMLREQILQLALSKF